MQLHTHIMGYVSFAEPASQAMETAESDELNMLRCRYGAKPKNESYWLLHGLLPIAKDTIHNPNTLQALADIFHTTVELAF